MISNLKFKYDHINFICFREYRIKSDIVFHTNGTASYNEKKIFVFQPHESVDSDDFIFTTVNVPLLVSKIASFDISFISNFR